MPMPTPTPATTFPHRTGRHRLVARRLSAATVPPRARRPRSGHPAASRIYILPTRRGYAFLATLGMTLLTSLNYSLSLGFVATFMLAGLVATALVHTFRNLSGIELRPLAAGETFAGAVMPFTLALAGGATPRYAVTLTARGCSTVTVDVLPDSALPVALELLTPRRGRIVLGRVTLSSEFPMGLWHAWAYVHFPLAGIAFPTPEVDPPPLPPGDFGQDDASVIPRHRRGSRRTARLPARRSAAAHRLEVGRARRRLAHETVRRRQRRRARRARLGFAARLACRAPKKIARLTAWVLAAERAARPFALRAPGIALAAGQGRDHRRSALTALALMPEQNGHGGARSADDRRDESVPPLLQEAAPRADAAGRRHAVDRPGALARRADARRPSCR